LKKLERLIGKSLREQGLKLALAESCTGGLLSSMITDVAGSSDYFLGSVVAYDNGVKQTELGVKATTLKKYGAVSKETVLEMARGVRKRLQADISAAITGIAGPGGGSHEKPVGLVFVGYADKAGSLALKFNFGLDRRRTKERAAQAALELLRRKLLKL